MGSSLDIALGRRNRNKIINPDGMIDQRNNGAKVVAAVAGNVYYGPDRRCIQTSQANKLSIQQYAIALGSRQATNYSAKVTVEAIATVAAADYNIILLQAFEGLRMRDLLWGSSFARPVAYTIQAQVPVAGPYSIALRNTDNTRSYVTTVTFQQANVLETHSILVPGDTQGAWPIDTSKHSTLALSVGSGANLTTANLNQWQAGNFIQAAGAMNIMGTAGNTVYVAYDQLERDFATDFMIEDPEDGRRKCQQYHRSYISSSLAERSGIRIYGYAPAAGTQLVQAITFDPPMRAKPTPAMQGVWTLTNSTTQPQVGSTSTTGFEFYVTSTAAGMVDCYQGAAGVGITLNAELV